jgi:hypothetical protein
MTQPRAGGQAVPSPLAAEAATVRPVELSCATAGDALAAAAFPGPGRPDDLACWVASELEKVIAAAPADHTDLLTGLVGRIRAFPAQQAPVHLVMMATRHWRPVTMPLEEARAVLGGPGVTCWWRPHPVIVGFDLLVTRPAEGLADPEFAALFFQANAPAGTWGGDPR